MSSSDRLAELRRQRALVQSHLTWLDREIAEAEAKNRPVAAGVAASQRMSPATPASVPPPAGPPDPAAPAPPSDPAAISDPAEVEAEAMLDEYRVAPGDLQRNVRRGCLLYFAVGFVLFCAGVTGLYFALRH